MGVSSSAFVKTLGIDTTNSELAHDDGKTVHFLVSRNRKPNYLQYCYDPFHTLSKPEKNPISIINQYTDHNSDLYTKVNLALASDSPNLKDLGTYIKDLRYSIYQMPTLEQGNLYRGVELSPTEVEQMEKLQTFFIPSFTSASSNSDMAYKKNSLFVIKSNYGSPQCCTISSELSKFYLQEQETLISCYSVFRLDKREHVKHNLDILSFYLDEFSYFS